MHEARRLIRNHRLVAAAILALALVLRLIVPTGFMPAVENGRFVIAVCSGTAPATTLAPAAMPHGMSHALHAMPHTKGAHDAPAHQTGHPGADQPCAFAGLSMASLAAIDPVLLAAALLFVVALALRMAAPIATAAPAYLRPPLRGPPITA